MPLETRRIFFDHQEVRGIIDRYFRRPGVRVPLGVIFKIDIVEAHGEKEVVFEVFDVLRDQTDIFLMSPKDLAGCVIKYCIDNRIPLPQAGTKGLSISGEYLVLDVELNTKEKLEFREALVVDF